MQTEQICKECGKVFLRSLYHPQITICPQCKNGNDTHCIYCKNSRKDEWCLRCSITGKDVTNRRGCSHFRAENFTPMQTQEISEIMKITGA